MSNPKAYPLSDPNLAVSILEVNQLASHQNQLKKGANETRKTHSGISKVHGLCLLAHADRGKSLLYIFFLSKEEMVKLGITELIVHSRFARDQNQLKKRASKSRKTLTDISEIIVLAVDTEPIEILLQLRVCTFRAEEVLHKIYLMCKAENLPCTISTRNFEGPLRLLAYTYLSPKQWRINSVSAPISESKYHMSFFSLSNPIKKSGFSKKEKRVIPNKLLKESIFRMQYSYKSPIFSQQVWNRKQPEKSMSKYSQKTKNRCSNERLHYLNPHEEIHKKKVKAILNKITPDNFDRQSAQLTLLKYTTKASIDDLAYQISEKALLEPKFCEIYARLSRHLTYDSRIDNGISTFSMLTKDSCKHVTYNLRRALVIKCEIDFVKGLESFSQKNEFYFNNIRTSERMSTVQDISTEKKNHISDFTKALNKSEEKIALKIRNTTFDWEKDKNRLRAFGNINFLGQLYRYGLLTRRIIIECISTLLMKTERHFLEKTEAACKLISVVGFNLENPTLSSYKTLESFHYAVHNNKQEVSTFLEKIKCIRSQHNIDNRTYFICQDLIELYLRNWRDRKPKEIPKKIEEIHKMNPKKLAGNFQNETSLHSSSLNCLISKKDL